jgi:hypothetical protein
MAHIVDASGSVVVAPQRVSSMAATNVTVTLTLSVAAAADKAVLIVIDGGANQAPLKFAAKTVASTSIPVSVSGVPPGSHVMLASVDGYAPNIDVGTFT